MPTLMMTDRTSRQEIEGAFKGVTLSPVWTSGHRTQPERAGTDLEWIGESSSGVTCDSNDLSKTATPAFHQEVVSRMVSDAGGQQRTNG
jgi:hypothetical protein